jgi:hypothetical protein
MRLQYLKAIARIWMTIRKFWQSSSGDWQQLNKKIDAFANAELQNLTVRRRDRRLIINLEIAADRSITDAQISSISQELANELDTPVSLTVRIFPMTLFEAPSQPPE